MDNLNLLEADVIVVDDDAVVRSTITSMLEEAGHAVVAAESAFEAYEILSERPFVKTAVIDLQMPGLGGAELALVIGQARPNLAVVIISGGSVPREKELPDRMVFLPKPFTGSELSHAIYKAQALTSSEQSIGS